MPTELCVCQEIAREQQRINVFAEKRKFGKVVTVIEGLDEKQLNLKDLTKDLKAKLACGGTLKNGRIELQGKHKSRVKDVLVGLGFSPEMIEIR